MMMHSNTTRRFLAFTMAMMAVGSLAACSQSDRTMNQAPGGTSEVRGGYDSQEQSDNNMSRVNQPSEQQGGGREFFTTLKKGQPVNYYTQEFQRMGYDVTDVNRSGDQITYDLQRGDERFMVNLTTDERDNQMVSNIDTKEYHRVGGASGQNEPQQGEQKASKDQKDQEMNHIVQQVDKLPTGKKPIDYLPMLSKWGDVRKFDAGDKNASAEIETSKNQKFKVEMKLDPQKQVVTDLNVDKDNFWSL